MRNPDRMTISEHRKPELRLMSNLDPIDKKDVDQYLWRKNALTKICNECSNAASEMRAALKAKIREINSEVIISIDDASVLLGNQVYRRVKRAGIHSNELPPNCSIGIIDTLGNLINSVVAEDIPLHAGRLADHIIEVEVNNGLRPISKRTNEFSKVFFESLSGAIVDVKTDFVDTLTLTEGIIGLYSAYMRLQSNADNIVKFILVANNGNTIEHMERYLDLVLHPQKAESKSNDTVIIPVELPRAEMLKDRIVVRYEEPKPEAHRKKFRLRDILRHEPNAQ